MTRHCGPTPTLVDHDTCPLGNFGHRVKEVDKYAALGRGKIRYWRSAAPPLSKLVAGSPAGVCQESAANCVGTTSMIAATGLGDRCKTNRLDRPRRSLSICIVRGRPTPGEPRLQPSRCPVCARSLVHAYGDEAHGRAQPAPSPRGLACPLMLRRVRCVTRFLQPDSRWHARGPAAENSE